MATVKETKQGILSYFTSLEGKQIVSGQFGSYGEGTSYATAEDQLRRIFNKSGLYPALTGMDYAMPGGMDSATQFMIDKWKQGYLVHASWHMPNPFTGGGAGGNESNTYALAQLVDERTTANKKFRQLLDSVAFQLQKLQNAGVVVLWRPFHEMNGDWFWWKATGGKEEAFKNLWIYTWKYLVQTKLLDNLIWCFSPNYAWDQWHSMLPSKYYPGAQYVDMVGFDKYAGVNERPVKFDTYGDYTDMTKMNKPMAIFEFGGIPASSEGWDVPNAVNWQTIIPQIMKDYPKFVLFQAWEWVWQIAADNYVNVKPMMESAAVVTLKELPSFAGGVTPPPDPDPEDPEDPQEPPPAGATEAQVKAWALEVFNQQKAALAAQIKQEIINGFDQSFRDAMERSVWKFTRQ